MVMDSIPSFLAASDFWMARWLTPFWFVGLGIVAGLIVLASFLGLFFLLAPVTKGLEPARKNGTLHWVALAITAVLGGLVAWYARTNGDLSRAFLIRGEFATEEWALVSLGITAMLGVIIWAVLFCSSSRFFGELKSLLFEGIGFGMLVTLAAVAAIGLAATPLVDNPAATAESLPLFFGVQAKNYEFTIPGTPPGEKRTLTKVEVKYEPRTLGAVRIESNRRVLLADASEIQNLKFSAMSIDADSPRVWERSMGAGKSPLPMISGAEVYVQNEEIDDAKVSFSIVSYPPVQEASTILLTGLFTTVFGLLFFLMQGAAPKTAAIALSAAKSEFSQPLPKVLITLVGLAILLFVFLPFHTFGEDIKLLKDCGIILILIATTFQAVWSASTSVSDEIEGRTALTLLSKPIPRRSFIVGKILGVFWIVMLMFLILGAFELFAVAYKPIVDARENSLEQPPWQQCHFEMRQTIPGLALAFMQSVVLGCISVAIGTRVSMIANFSICFSIYVLGHLTPMIMDTSAGALPLVEFFAQLISAVVPNLNHFSMEAAIDADVGVPWSVIASVFIYTTIYGIGATLLGLLLFEERDLA